VELNWSTFLIEVVNFLILVWVLKRFLYRPVLSVLERRRQKVRAELAEASEARAEARALQDRYEGRLADWEQERRRARDELGHQLAQERSRRMQQLDEALQKERLRQQARDRQQRAQWRSQAEDQALQLGAAFAARLLKGLACPELDVRLQQLFIEQLGALSEEATARLREAWAGGTATVEVVNARAVDQAGQAGIRRALEERLGPSTGQWHFRREEGLIAGLRVSVNGWMLQANLEDELRFFTEQAATDG
jgi:F-type H+-transporting ATPase subunit b